MKQLNKSPDLIVEDFKKNFKKGVRKVMKSLVGYDYDMGYKILIYCIYALCDSQFHPPQEKNKKRR